MYPTVAFLIPATNNTKMTITQTSEVGAILVTLYAEP